MDSLYRVRGTNKLFPTIQKGGPRTMFVPASSSGCQDTLSRKAVRRSSANVPNAVTAWTAAATSSRAQAALIPVCFCHSHGCHVAPDHAIHRRLLREAYSSDLDLLHVCFSHRLSLISVTLRKRRTEELEDPDPLRPLQRVCRTCVVHRRHPDTCVVKSGHPPR